ncbi:glycosyltransferase [Tessaracoccus antarcticus]|uniref:Glycosyltransferase family 1 protein n=1 Tax=Tessaracoccus antarcticus TaxID=2479848 RepID=A0A3M0GJT4_9ACTN|nr:glycosyltransferase [Tessaracoccus antarcticus]RMB61893.1 glycosyltransferase family 1 protein [Tessaracoccus antarcticus]
MVEKVRVLQVMASLDRGGAEAVVMDWLRHVDPNRIAFDFIVNDGDGRGAHEDEVVALGGRVVRAPRFKGWNVIGYALWWWRCFKDHPEWDIIHAHHTVPGFVYIPIARTLGRKVIAHSHTAGREPSLSGLIRTALRLPLRYSADLLLGCSQAAATWMFGNKEVRIIRNGIGLDRFADARSARQSTRAILGLQESMVVGHVGRFATPKNHERILRIFARISAQEPSARLVLVGDGELRDVIEKRVNELGLGDTVHLLGVRKDVPELIAAMDVLLFPSLYEGLPVAVIEAQVSSLPCVVADTVTSEVAVTEGVTFMRLADTDEEWADAVMTAWVCGSERRSRVDELRAAGYDSVESANSIQELYLRLSSSLGRRV